MDPSEFNIINGILEMWKFTVQSVMFLVLWRAVFGAGQRKWGRIAAALFFIVSVGTGFLPLASWARYAVLLFLVTGYGVINYGGEVRKTVFTVLTYYNFHSLSYLIANSLYAKNISICLKGLKVFEEDYERQMYHAMAVGMLWLVFCYTLFFMLMTVIFYRIIKELAYMAWLDVILLSILNFVGSLIARIISGLLVINAEDGLFILFDERPDLLWKLPVAAALIYIGEAALTYFWHRYRSLLCERQKAFVEEQQVKAMKKRLEEAENFYGNIRKVRHEMKNHMTNMKGLAKTGQYGEIESYIQRMDETMQELEYKYTTGNAVTDVIINDRWRRAKKSGIRFEADFWYGGEIPVFDLGIILSNLLDNAIEACEKLEAEKGFIRVLLKRRKQFLLLEVENSFNGIVHARADGLLPVTTKQGVLPGIVAEHGIGLENVRDVAEKYLGGINVKTKGNIFHVTVMLQYQAVKDERRE